MKREILVQGRTAGANALLDRLETAAKDASFDRFDAAVAYVTISGITAILKHLGRIPSESRWVVGLDDAVTQPGAITYLKSLSGAQVRVAALASQGRRFHPKVFRLAASGNPAKAVMVVGSGNLTLHGLGKNCEAAILLAADTNVDAQSFDTVWAELWATGTVPTAVVLEAYRKRYELARTIRKALTKAGAAPEEPAPAKPGQDVLESEALELYPSTANTSWVDVGSSMGNGREMEFPKALLPFFGILTSDASPQLRQFALTDGKEIELAIVKRIQNGMWRIHFTQDVPGAGTLRQRVNGKLLRSDKAAVFERTEIKTVFKIRFAKFGTKEYNRLENRAKHLNALGRTQAGTSGRNYGFF